MTEHFGTEVVKKTWSVTGFRQIAVGTITMFVTAKIKLMCSFPLLKALKRQMQLLSSF